MHYPPITSWRSRAERFQTPLNALPVPARQAQRDIVPPVDVDVRVIWPRDGEQTIRARAVAYTTRAVLCHWTDPRLAILGAWFAPGDVARLGH